ncbi:hypothetical protein B0J14DRAFT_81810 [Halenospora varia]|nr:hypothetical protein B0J14DRAFT_81810 [Halenospora varia]
MSADVVAPVKNILKSIDSGIKLGRRVARSAKHAPPIQAQEISYSAQNLQKSLDRSSRSISEAYAQTVEICGEPFTHALEDDRAISNRLKDLRIALIDQIDSCQDFDEEPDLFEPAAFTAVLEIAERCSEECIIIFSGIRDRHFQACLQTIGPDKTRGDRNISGGGSRGESSYGFPSPPSEPSSPSTHMGNLRMNTPPPSAPPKPKSPWAIESPSQFDLGPTQPPGSSVRRKPVQQAIQSPSRGTLPFERPIHFIPQELVHSRITSNEEFLARRRRSRIMFQTELRQSIGSIEEHKVLELSGEAMKKDYAELPSNESVSFEALPTYSDAANVNTYSSGSNTYSSNTYSSNNTSTYSSASAGTYSTSPNTAYSSSPIGERISKASSNSYDVLMTRQRSQGQFSTMTRSSDGSSMMPDRKVHRPDSQDLVSPLQQLHTSTSFNEHPATDQKEKWEGLSSTLHVPGYGSGIESGLEVVMGVDHDNEKMPVDDENSLAQNTPTPSMKSFDYPIRHDTSFYKFGGFCDGAKAMMRGETGFKVVKRPSGHYSATVSARCIKCSYEVSWGDVEKDRLLQRDGIYGNSGIRWRQKFISKCHVKTNSIEEPYYACIFCIEEHKTVEEHDATVFFSVGQLFRHLAKHPRPLPNVYGITTIYGYQPPEVLDFDLHFTTTDPRPTQYSLGEIATKVATRASAQASSTHNPKPTARNARDPDGNETLHFASGARIVGITFPERWAGAWCVGYHDGARGSFPADKVVLQLPSKEDVLMNSQSNLTAVARWDFKPKEAKDGGWLKFSKGDKIACIGYTFPDHWVWTGQTSKGKWGIFPSTFVHNLKETESRAGPSNPRPVSARSPTSKSSGMSFGSMFPIGRSKTKHERSGSIRSTGSGGSSSMVAGQPGLEVVRQHGSSWKS